MIMENVRLLMDYHNSFKKKGELEDKLVECESLISTTKKQIKNLEVVMKKELSDVEALSKRSISNALLSIFGKMDEKSKKERQEAENAKLAYDLKQQELDFLSMQYNEIKNSLDEASSAFANFINKYYELKKELDESNDQDILEYITHFKSMMEALNMIDIYEKRKEEIKVLLDKAEEIYSILCDATDMALRNAYLPSIGDKKYRLLDKAQHHFNILHKMVYELNYKYKRMRKIVLRDTLVPNKWVYYLDVFDDSRGAEIAAHNHFIMIKNDVALTCQDFKLLINDIDKEILIQTQKYNYSKVSINKIEENKKIQ